MKHKFAAQLFTLRNELEKDFPGVLRELKNMGWQAVQISGLRGHTAEEIAKALRETGLKTAGMHVSLEMINNDLPEVLRQAELFGTKDLRRTVSDGRTAQRAWLSASQKQFE